MTRYGTIPTEPVAPSRQQIAKERIQSSIGTPRSWKEMVQLQSLNIPSNLNESVERIRTNGAFFRANYLIIILFLIFFNLLWQPMSLIVFLTMIIAWLFLYFLRDDHIMIFGLVIHDQLVMIALLAATIVMLSVTSVTDKIVMALSTGVVVVLVHGALRTTNDLVVVDPELGGEGTNTPLRDAASASYSLSM
ncbi:PRA1 family protein F3-like [Tripterygium wilfordii]|uniref:PRA1 family protein n=1 Tax=Tripterygium wilfordii TaxID=458696 RepID=A0A7J7BWR4_TRIWF|nr:PRA1 family protein F3-like isoform X2 [Tripterygium wilfordii]KAF5726057.1 PRA1 family protein F3-like [Tripterygium wilfordii]